MRLCDSLEVAEWITAGYHGYWILPRLRLSLVCERRNNRSFLDFMALQVTRVMTVICLLDSWYFLCGSVMCFNTLVYYAMLTSVSGLRHIYYEHIPTSYFLPILRGVRKKISSSVCPSVHTKLLCSHWADFSKTVYGNFTEISPQISILFKI
jgi:hypothetical protein